MNLSSRLGLVARIAIACGTAHVSLDSFCLRFSILRNQSLLRLVHLRDPLQFLPQQGGSA